MEEKPLLKLWPDQLSLFDWAKTGKLDKRSFRVLFISAEVNSLPSSWMKRGLDSSDPYFSNLSGLISCKHKDKGGVKSKEDHL